MAKAVKKITSEVLGVISRLVVEQGPMAWVARITDGQLDRKVYVAFNEAVGLTGITITKLDGTASGGIVFAIAKRLGLPLRFIGVGEAVEDLGVFESEHFMDALFDRK